MYAKLFSRITESSLMEEQIPVRYTFVMLLAIADPTGLVVGTEVAIARRLNMPLAQFKKCIQILQKPDPHSNSKEEDGRRLLPSHGERGYQIVNFVKYRDLRDEDAKRSYMRNYMKDYRSRKLHVKPCKEMLTVLAQAEADVPVQADPDKESINTKKKFRKPTLEEVSLKASEIGLSSFEAGRFFNFYESNGWKSGRNPMANWVAALRNWKPDQRGPQKPESKQREEQLHAPRL